jgi:steroid 5-alpha reductase family enzyme
MIVPYLLACVFLSVAMAGAWGLQRWTGNAGWADSVWSLALGVAGVFVALVPGLDRRSLLVAVLIAAWSLRLGLHIARRSLRGPEDARYAALRTEWGDRFQGRLFLFLQIQAAAAALLALSMALAAHNPAPWGVLDAAGIAILAAAIAGEAVADQQLHRFKRDPANKGRLCDVGLWSLSRHPNYFFEWLGWVAYPLFAIGTIPPAWGWGWLALSGPAWMYVLLVYISGIPPLEQHMEHSLGAPYRAYQGRVSRFVPLPPKADRT